jgi:phage terminase Nu1 subunit (DNA packaging protein)
MPLASSVLKLLLRTVWPWVIAAVWPHVRAWLEREMSALLLRLMDKVRGKVATRLDRRGEDALTRAKAAEAQVAQAGSDEERVRLEATARVWREVAEQFRQENEALRAQVDELTQGSLTETRERLAEATPTLEDVDGRPHLRVGGERTALPPLPEK